ncbi:MAG: DUF4340 domain-containing protein [Oscillospiraceae bacterium]|nr:DUF4340 domain-containing protein [Oscillospiraceae bacterium]
MKSRVRSILIFGGILLLLVGVVVLLSRTGEPAEEEALVEASSEALVLYAQNPEDIEYLTVTNEAGSYRIERFGGEDDGFTVWTIGEFIGLPIDYEKVNDTVTAAASITSQQLVAEDAPDLSIYGLTQPRAAVRVEFSDSENTVRELCIGNDTPIFGKTYFCFMGENTVYTVNTSDISYFLDDKYSLIQKTVYRPYSSPDPEDETDYRRINKMVIAREDIDYDIVIEYDTRAENLQMVTGNSSAYVLTSPVSLDLSPDKSHDVMNMVFWLTANDIAVVSPTPEQLAEYGLDQPYADIFMDMAGESFQMKVGNQNAEKTGRYAYVDGIDIIYYFDNYYLPWITAMPLALTTAMITSNYIYDVSDLVITVNGSSSHFTLTGSGLSDFTVKLDGMPANADEFKTLYQFILKAPPEELYFEATGKEPDLTVVITAENNKDTLEFTHLENRRTAIALNGQTSFTCKTAYAERLAQNLTAFKNGDRMIETW